MSCAVLCYAMLFGDVEPALRQLCTYGRLYDRKQFGHRLLERCLQDPCAKRTCNCACEKIGDEIYDALAEVGSATASYLASRVGRNYNAVVRRLEELSTRGLVRKLKCGDLVLYYCVKT